MVWDGLPFSTRAEFAGLMLFVVVFFSRELRRTIRQLLVNIRWHILVRPLLVAMCAVKLLSFAWAPLGAGFATCYRSLYQPLEDTSACEKSYEAPFTQGSGAPLATVSRMDKVVDFGVAPFDWNLPFINDFPRLHYLWLERFPFTASFATKVTGVASDRILPIYGIGKISVKINGDMVSHVENYARDFMIAIPLPEGSSELLVEYEYRDDNLAEPETAPEPRGPYAR
ncbi:MAG: hypothetical protein RL072_75, partial [Actinomycetota bacterium]